MPDHDLSEEKIPRRGIILETPSDEFSADTKSG